jgi:predicted nucleic acid-binding protein
MIVLDTNVLSEPLRPSPDDAVLRWMRSHRDVAVTAVSVAELLTGARRLAEGSRRERLIAAIEKILVGSRVLPLDDRAARIYARMQERRRTAGHPLSVEDGMIAAITVAHGAALATRNTADFEGLDLSLINPWTND